MNLTSKSKKLALILAIAFVLYNVVLFVLCGFIGHNAVFWISWVFMVLAFAGMAGVGILLGKRSMFLRDWLFNYPIIKHTTVYIIIEFILSTIFIIFVGHLSWRWAFAVQIIALCIWLVFAISCLMAKETIDEIHTKAANKTAFIKLLMVDAEMLAAKCSDNDSKKVFEDFAEQVRMSDPMSSETLFELEKEIMLVISKLDTQLAYGDIEGATQNCKHASLMLTERNKKTKALK